MSGSHSLKAPGVLVVLLMICLISSVVFAERSRASVDTVLEAGIGLSLSPDVDHTDVTVSESWFTTISAVINAGLETLHLKPAAPAGDATKAGDLSGEAKGNGPLEAPNGESSGPPNGISNGPPTNPPGNGNPGNPPGNPNPPGCGRVPGTGCPISPTI